MQEAPDDFRVPAFRTPDARTAYGVPLAADERVVFAHEPPPIGVGERILFVVIGIWMLPVLLTGILIIIYAFRKPDRAWFVTNRRVINVTPKGVREVALEDVVWVSNMKGSSTMELRGGAQNVTLPLAGTVNGVHIQAIARDRQLAMTLPAVETPP